MQDILLAYHFECTLYEKYKTCKICMSLQNTDKLNNKHKIMIFKCTHIKIKA